MPRNDEAQIMESPFLDGSLVQRAQRRNLVEQQGDWFPIGEIVDGHEVQARVLWVPEEFVRAEQSTATAKSGRERGPRPDESTAKDQDLARKMTVKLGIFAASVGILYGITGANESPVELGNDVVVGAKTVAAPLKFLVKIGGRVIG